MLGTGVEYVLCWKGGGSGMGDVSKLYRGIWSLPKSIGVTMRPPVTGDNTEAFKNLHKTSKCEHETQQISSVLQIIRQYFIIYKIISNNLQYGRNLLTQESVCLNCGCS
jgi:hypothetical protein